jgi:hypothetical protein
VHHGDGQPPDVTGKKQAGPRPPFAGKKPFGDKKSFGDKPPFKAARFRRQAVRPGQAQAEAASQGQARVTHLRARFRAEAATGFAL